MKSLVIGIVALIAGCGGATGATRTAYGTEVAHCIANEQALVARRGTTLAQDQADLRAERARCDAALTRIEAGVQ